MPFYEYQCKACGAVTEALQKINDAPLKKCPECGKSQLHKLVSAPVFRLKGGGWYETDFKTDKDKQRNLVEKDGGGEKSEDKAKVDPTAKPEAKAADAKPEAKAEPKKETPAKAATTASRGASKTGARPAGKAKTAAKTKAGKKR